MFRRLCIAVVMVYVSGLGALTLLWGLGADRFWWLALLNMFGTWLFVPAALVPLAALLLRSRWLAAGAAIGLLWFLVGALPGLLPQSGAAARLETQTLRVVSANILYSNRTPDETAAAIVALNADILAIQELAPDGAAALNAALGTTLPYRFELATYGASGFGIYSRYPITIESSPVGVRLLQAQIDVNGQPITLFNVHPTVPSFSRGRFTPRMSTRARDSELTALLRVLDATQGMVIVAGDLNTAEREPQLARFRTRLTDTFRATNIGPGFSFPNPGATRNYPVPLIRLDYIWTSPAIIPTSAAVHCERVGTDHCWTHADLVLPGAVQAGR